MKLKSLSMAAIAAAICGWTAGEATAQTQTSYTAGDLFVGFRATDNFGASQNYLINIGQASTYRDLTAGTTINLSLGNIGVDLTGLYGSDWHMRDDVFWSVSGGNTSSSTVSGDSARTAYYSNYGGGPAWDRLGFSGSASSNGAFQSQSLRYIQSPIGDPILSTANSSVGVIQTATTSNSYGSFQVEGNQTAAYGRFGGGGENSFAVGGVAGTGNELSLYRLETIPFGGPATAPGEYLGYFSINSSGLVSFTAVPEPGTIGLALAALAGLAIFAACRRHKANAKA